MDVKLHVDLETLQLIEGPGFRNPVTSLRFKRGDAALLEVSFLEGGTTAVAIGDPATLEIRFGIKPRNRYDIGYLVHDAVWTMPAVNAENPVYQCSPSFNTVELDSALGVGSSTGSELAEITLMGEITWREGSGEPTSTRTFLVVVENDVNRGTEGVPTSAEPPYPLPQNIASPTDVAAAMTAHLNATDPHPKYLRHDAQESLTATQRGYVRNAILAAEAPPDLTLPRQNINGVWYPVVYDGEPTNYQPDQMIDGTPGWKGRIAVNGIDAWISTKNDLTTANDGWVQINTTFIGPFAPPQVNSVNIDSYESIVSFGLVEAGRNYHVRIDNFSDIPVSGEYFGISNVNYGSASFSNVQNVSSNYLDSYLGSDASFSATLNAPPTMASDIYVEFTFTADGTFDWSGNCFFGSYSSGYYVAANVTLTEI
jgi:hypothetical protein